ncbi:unnamed protein product [Danaus chrysippus]|uniref:(African queen) hypothetical protein n=1 Tax=Danaus chrysippus TaxID=151541 RepID=A0A8J2VXU8_9NEOP|nr:unnamed protein product [Danaus chrysippus]
MFLITFADILITYSAATGRDVTACYDKSCGTRQPQLGQPGPAEMRNFKEYDRQSNVTSGQVTSHDAAAPARTGEGSLSNIVQKNNK